ncbi:hypothetical protein AAFC00_000268 [Neodothiora populina]|uniref:ER membrane protein complex subunit 2 n=1 Tax=Neodothiora populina TaxID=2781224 RepID=A0ABR3PDL6_9PEZI
MSVDLLQPPGFVSPGDALAMSQAAPTFFRSTRPSSLPYPLSILTSSESPEQWHTYENLLVACLRTGDDGSAFICLKELTDRFGESNERVQYLTGLYREATAEDDKALQEVSKWYDTVIAETPINFPIRKRRIALLRSLGKKNEAIKALTEFLDASPVDAEAWAELSDLYFTQGLYAQAIFCLEEVLLITPNAWNIHARLGEVTYAHAQQSLPEDAATSTTSGADALKLLSNSMRHFCRSLELCEDYLRAYYGLKITTTRLMSLTPPSSSKSTTVTESSTTTATDGDLAPPSLATLQKLNEKATAKLAEIVRRGGAREKGWDGYDDAELSAARELLKKDGAEVVR